MNIYWFDLLQLLFFAFSAYGVWRFYNKKNKLWLTPIIAVVISFVFAPVNITNKNASKKFSTLPKVTEKVVVMKESFEEKQDKKLKELKKESKETRNEKIN